jgi:hypothetical protein
MRPLVDPNYWRARLDLVSFFSDTCQVLHMLNCNMDIHFLGEMLGEVLSMNLVTKLR